MPKHKVLTFEQAIRHVITHTDFDPEGTPIDKIPDDYLMEELDTYVPIKELYGASDKEMLAAIRKAYK